MRVTYLFADTGGDIPAGNTDLVLPFRISPEKTHGFLTLGHYFKAIEAFILRDHGGPLMEALRTCSGDEISGPREISEILIRTEKHGALYHISSVEVLAPPRAPIKFSVSTALGEEGGSVLFREHRTIEYLNNTHVRSFLPETFMTGRIDRQHKGQRENLYMLLAEWFRGYHEWHLTDNGKGTEHEICIWDTATGPRKANKKETFEIYRQASEILTLYYGGRTFEQIHPWHHAAGDFIVKASDGAVDMKITTARGYASLTSIYSHKTADPVTALVYFFLNLSIKNRLDRLDGLGKPVLSGGVCVRATIEGFFNALLLKHEKDVYNAAPVQEILSLLQSFSAEELTGLFHPILEFLKKTSPADFKLVATGLEDHVTRLHQGLEAYRL